MRHVDTCFDDDNCACYCDEKDSEDEEDPFECFLFNDFYEYDNGDDDGGTCLYSCC